MKKILGVALAAVLLTGCYTDGEADYSDATTMTTEGTTMAATTTTTANEFPTTVYFDFDNDQLTENAYQILDTHADYLATHPNSTVVIEGHADAKGTQAYNLGLSQRRARTISTYLLSKGVSQDQMTEVSFGKENLVSTQDDLNRRVEIVYQG